VLPAIDAVELFGLEFILESDIEPSIVSVDGVEAFAIAESVRLKEAGIAGERGIYSVLPRRVGEELRPWDVPGSPRRIRGRKGRIEASEARPEG
jgi:hypothetical protein